MNQNEKKLKELIEGAESILVTTHSSPDPDAKSSSILTYHALKKYLNKEEVDLIIQDQDKYGSGKVDWGYAAKEIEVVNSGTLVDLSVYDLIILTDVDEINRAFFSNEGDRDGYKLVIMDHHQPSEGAEENADIFINNTLSSAAEQVYIAFKNILGEEWMKDEYVSELTQFGIVADTNRFMYDIVKPSTYEIMAELIRVKQVDIEEYMYNLSSLSKNSYQVLRECLNNFRIVDNLGYSWITKDFIQQNDLTKTDMLDGVSSFLNDYLRRLDDIDWGFTLKESLDEEGSWSCSFRSVNGVKEVNKIASKLGGGGHKWAAGVRFTAEDKDDAIQKVLSAIE